MAEDCGIIGKRDGSGKLMEFRVTLIETEEGVAASCPSLRGCHSQGETREEALADSFFIARSSRSWK